MNREINEAYENLQCKKRYFNREKRQIRGRELTKQKAESGKRKLPQENSNSAKGVWRDAIRHSESARQALRSLAADFGVGFNFDF